MVQIILQITNKKMNFRIINRIPSIKIKQIKLFKNTRNKDKEKNKIQIKIIKKKNHFNKMTYINKVLKKERKKNRVATIIATSCIVLDDLINKIFKLLKRRFNRNSQK